MVDFIPNFSVKKIKEQEKSENNQIKIPNVNVEKPYILNEGVCYLRILEYYAEEKKRFQDNFDFETCESFIEKFFDINAEMKIKVFNKKKLEYELGKIC